MLDQLLLSGPPEVSKVVVSGVVVNVIYAVLPRCARQIECFRDQSVDSVLVSVDGYADVAAWTGGAGVSLAWSDRKRGTPDA